MGKPEGKVENYLIKQSENRDFLCFKFTSPGHKGVPDRVVIGKDKVIFVELKSENGHPSKQQKFVIKKMRDRGADVRLCFTKEEVDALMNEFDQLPDFTPPENTMP